MSKMLEAAIWYRSNGMHPIPCKRADKKPLVSWKAYEARQPTEEEIRQWWGTWPDANVALITGRKMLVVDLDGAGAEELLWSVGIVLPDAAPRVKTGDGEHVYLSCEIEVRNDAKLLGVEGQKRPAVDVRGDGGYVIAPPSVHENGNVYAWNTKKLSTQFPPAPQKLLDLISSTKPKSAPRQEKTSGQQDGDRDHWVAEALRGVGEGQRDNVAAKLAGYFHNRRVSTRVMRALLLDFAARCTPALEDRDIDRVIASVSRYEQEPQETQEGAEEESKIERISDVLADLKESLKIGPARTIATHLPGLNRLLIGGFQPGEFVVLGARPGVGKTALALSLARHAAQKNHIVLIASFEMLNRALARRMLAQEGMNASILRSAHGVNWDELDSTIDRLKELPIWMLDTARKSIDILAAVAMMGHVDLLIVDYLQLVGAPADVKDRRLQVESVSQAMKALARTRGMTVMALSSLRRLGVGGEQERPPTMGDLRESGSIEHDADIVMLLHRPVNELEADLSIPKNRDGATGICKLVFQPEHILLVEREEQEHYPEKQHRQEESHDVW